MQSFKKSSFLLSLALWLAANSLAGTSELQLKGEITQIYSDVNPTMRIGLMGLGMKQIYKQRRRRGNYHGGRIAYYGNNHSTTFQLECIDKDLSLRAGDIEKNPGPIKNPCSICQKSIAKYHRALPCEKMRKEDSYKMWQCFTSTI